MHSIPFSSDALLASLSQELHATSEVPTVILAGHQILSNKGLYSRVLGVFPEVTWKMGLQMIDSNRDVMKRMQIFTVINDWAELRNNPDAEDVRCDYWGDETFAIHVDNKQLFTEDLLPGIGYEGVVMQGRFSEKALQNRFTKLFPKSEEACVAPNCQYSFNKCSSEVIMLIRELYRSGIRRMIAFMPNICVLPITYASERLVAGDFNHDGLIRESFLIKNIFLNSKNPQLEADVFVDCQIDDVIIDPFL